MEFKKEKGQDIEDKIVENRTDLRKKKVLIKELTEACNGDKGEMDNVKELLDQKAEDKKL